MSGDLLDGIFKYFVLSEIDDGLPRTPVRKLNRLPLPEGVLRIKNILDESSYEDEG